MALFAAAIALGWLRRPDITPYLTQPAEITTEPVFQIGVEHVQMPQPSEKPAEQRPQYWPERLPNIQKNQKSLNTPLPDCTITQYELDGKQSLKGNINNLKDATITCKTKILKKTP